MSPVEYSGGKCSLRAYIALCSRYTATRLVLLLVYVTASDLFLEFNVDRSCGIAFGPNAGNLPSLFVGGKPLNWHIQLSISVFT